MANADFPKLFELKDQELLQNHCYIHGKWATARRGQNFPVTDPGSGQIWAECADGTKDDVEPAVHSSHIAFEKYSKVTPRQRAQILLKWHQLIDSNREDLAKILVYETGKPLTEAYGEIDYALTFVWWFVGEAERIQGSVITSAVPGRRSIVIKQPIGVVAGLVPWNFPVALMLRKASAALAAGCTMVVKPSPETPFTALSLGFLATRAGFPAGALNVVTTSLENTPEVAEALCLHPIVKKVTFTGSTRVGKIISGLCARNLKKATFELGGNCPFIVFDDANLDQALEQLMALKWRHAGQACVTANRVYVQQGIHDNLVKALVEKSSSIRVGHGMGEGTTIGPVTTARGLERAEALVKDAIDNGAQLMLGTGKRHRVEGHVDGYYMAPTILTGMTRDMTMSCEEIFAPILTVYAFEDEDEVVTRANNTSMGLTSYVFTKSVDRLWRLFEKLEAGMIGLNTGNCSAAEAPFGGIKDSGVGKESGKDVAINEFMVTKTGTLTVEDHY
ncbi:putative succinate-semialdehyde dehydrogenase [Pseudomassariella vexata]|uniref:succinate-semialdehyde dehydrogenase [NAD(P)(+)] n=1 Tax=Pseudomassariella vexata TaxID=1141098 RepID=A0A1Y2DEY2_9PEZI|nr:putative succinate-semialdehyde dehydrogenase [Pseudomassariella vexata]ORY57843.1 putative succinate-semialdehyde dehydrogenase [Pseudomassariella vexata]